MKKMASLLSEGRSRSKPLKLPESLRPLVLAVLAALATCQLAAAKSFQLEEATVKSIQAAFKDGSLTSEKLVAMYIERIARYNKHLNAFIEVNPDAIKLAKAADRERKSAGGYIGGLHGIPIAVKDNVGTYDKMNTTAGSFALLGSKLYRDSTLVKLLRKAGAIILGKLNLSEWANFRATNPTNGWSARGGFTRNPYLITADTCGSSSGTGSSVAANLVTLGIGSETDGSIICPASFQGLVGIKPTVGLVSRAGIIPGSHTQDTGGPMCRTLTDATIVLNAIVQRKKPDPRDHATRRCLKRLPKVPYTTFLKKDGLKGKRIGVWIPKFFDPTLIYLGTPGNGFNTTASDANYITAACLKLLKTIKGLGATVVETGPFPYYDNLTTGSTERSVFFWELKRDLATYFNSLKYSPVKTLADVIQFNKDNAELELMVQNQEFFEKVESGIQGTTVVTKKVYKSAKKTNQLISRKGVGAVIRKLKLDAIVLPTVFYYASTIAAIDGYPAISIPAGYTPGGMPFGLSFINTACTEPKLLEMAYAFEQATKFRKAPKFIGYKI